MLSGIYFIYIYFYVLHVLLDRSKNCVAGYIFDQRETISAPSKINIPILNSNQFIL